uniref:alanine--glyoxylate transaminase n=2 Tax=Chromera velia TaxID=505693 RepID=A0A2K8DNF8_9ALVE|nr:Alanine-glyoxylate aminotransferase [Chromera velia]|mmetsp:Transcript_1629/g.3342  ORF Transcript_1629/g.3342 Transcript_1629/m.3342 type:complete len:408 (-) Transcript_1629:1617-2840(-)|eukprot:Cvel_19313.t1-p1 / transcript=Cvel_19313.t1 / gene=Cvel_19313 / organism=Chromera_velia_CCMP2878 / gene_product=Serine--pyruvate aminotransferase, putative / transcript_product=Serine--pyruvate aminotransferase, putative / location=Cvel_scaffold1655:24430-29439(+) / protein_length=407 / sequence_SO=supercontig / SO=protein_coding / is_pseudo=false
MASSYKAPMPTVQKNPIKEVGNLNPPTRLLCGPGPGNAHPRVHAAMSLPQIGHLDPAFMALVEDLKALLRYVWQTDNEFTIPVSGTGSAAWEAAVANLTSPGDVHLTCVNGYFGERHCDMASRYGAKVERLERPWGEAFTLAEITAAMEKTKPQILWLCYAETSTGIRQPMEGIAELCRKHECLLMLDTVTAIGGVPLYLDKWGVDACYAGTQKCLSCPPGVAPLTLGPRALAKMAKRAEKGEKVANWYLDMTMIQKYLVAAAGAPRVYHHTAPISMVYAFREALTLIAEEGLEEVWKRHSDTAEYFWGLMADMGLEMLVKDPNERLTSLHTVKVPEGINAAEAVKHCREKFRIEIGGGLGAALSGKIWRIGLMGFNSRKEIALQVAAALKDALMAQGWKGPNKGVL